MLGNSSKWGAKSPDQEKIIALETQVKELKDLKLSAQLINKLKQDQKAQNQQTQQNQPKGENNQVKIQEQTEEGTRRTGPTNAFRDKTKSGRRFLPRIMNPNKIK